MIQLTFFWLRMFYWVYSIWGLIETLAHFFYLEPTYIIIILLSSHAKLTFTNGLPLFFVYIFRDSLLLAFLFDPLQNLLLFWVFIFNGLLLLRLHSVWSKTRLPLITILLNGLHLWTNGSLLGLLCFLGGSLRGRLILLIVEDILDRFVVGDGARTHQEFLVWHDRRLVGVRGYLLRYILLLLFDARLPLWNWNILNWHLVSNKFTRNCWLI